MEELKLAQTVSCGGCASKVNPVDLFSILGKLPSSAAQNLLVSFEKGDDACVYKLNDYTALIFTTDFIAPLIDNPYDFGRVSAANALSDVYAMGGTPLMALNIVCFDEKLGNSVLEQIMLGASETCKNSNTILCGGHTVKSPEIRYGLAVVGLVHPDKIITNDNGKPGDILVLTKPLGTGILCQALKYDMLDNNSVSILTEQLCTLNDKAANAMQEAGVKCATDITGFGLAGHLHKLAKASNCGAEINIDEIPFLLNSLELATDNVHSGIVNKNREFINPHIQIKNEKHPKLKLLFDPQTSGGILMAVPSEKINTVLSILEEADVSSFMIGKLTSDKAGSILIN